MRDNGLSPGNKLGSQVGAQGGGASEWDISACRALKASGSKYCRELRVCSLKEWRAEVRGTRSANQQSQEERKALVACGGPQGSWGLAGFG